MVDPRAVVAVIGGIGGLFALLYQVWTHRPRAIAAPANPNDRPRRRRSGARGGSSTASTSNGPTRTLYHYTNKEVNFKGDVHTFANWAHDQMNTRHEKTGLKVFIVVIPKEGLAGYAPYILLWV